MARAADREDSDQLLMEKIREGHQASLGILLDRYWSPLVAYAHGIVGVRETAKDVVQEVFIRVWKKRDRWSPTGTVNSYLYRITRNLSLNARRDGLAQKRRDDEAGERFCRRTPPRTPEMALDEAALELEVEAAIRSLPERRREVFILSRFHGLTHREIGQAMGISPQTVSNQMSAALAELRERLAHHLENL